MRDVFRVLAALILVQLATASGAKAFSSIELPSPFDQERDLIDRYWSWLTTEVNAPPHLPWPRIVVEPLPTTVRMAFVFPSEEAPWRKMRVVLSPRSVDRAAGPDRLIVVGELAHELVHYVLVLAENEWDVDAEIFRNDVHHHCDLEFMRLTRQIADFIWNIYHSNDAVRSVNHMVDLACWRDGHEIESVRRR